MVRSREDRSCCCYCCTAAAAAWIALMLLGPPSSCDLPGSCRCCTTHSPPPRLQLSKPQSRLQPHCSAAAAAPTATPAATAAALAQPNVATLGMERGGCQRSTMDTFPGQSEAWRGEGLLRPLSCNFKGAPREMLEAGSRRRGCNSGCFLKGPLAGWGEGLPLPLLLLQLLLLPRGCAGT